MAYTRVSKLIPQSAYKLKAPYDMTPQYITIHNTWNDASALAEVAYMSTNKNVTSFHVAIDDKHAVEAIPFIRNAWHAGDGSKGDGNRKSIGIEICYSKTGGAKYAQAEANAIEYIAYLLKQYGWTIDRVRWHKDWSGKNCPHRILDEGRASAVRDSISRKLAELNAPPVITPVSNVTYLQNGDKGDSVKRMQTDLQKAGFKLAIDGSYGPATEDIVKAFQKKYGLVVDGFFGQNTQAKLADVIKPKPIPKPATKPQVIHRVSIDGKQVGAYGDDENIIEQVRKALANNAKKIEIERK